MKAIRGTQYQVSEWGMASATSRRDPFNEIEQDVVFTSDAGQTWKVPAYWAGGAEWRIRFSPPQPGRYRFESVCSDASDAGLHGLTGTLDAGPSDGPNPLLRHGPPRVSANRRHFEHADGTPFFWLGDTWWMGLTRRLSWPDGFQTLAADRTAKGFTVVQIVAGLYPDMPAFDERGANEAGFPWERDYARINPAYFDMADLRIQWLVRSGLVPCIVGCWGYFLPWMGVEKMKKHWRNLVARWGAYPVAWCLAGEGVMPYYLSEEKEKEAEFQKRGWTELGRYVRAIDAYHHPVTIHPGSSARDTVEDQGVLDFDMLQTGHGDRQSLPSTVNLVRSGYERAPRMPVVNGEVCYEGIGESCRQEVQRLMFWTCLLSGACGHTYGANGIWQLNTRARPYGPSPHGMAWGNTPWEDAYRLPGPAQLGLAKRLLSRYAWWKFEPHPEWIEPRWSEQNYYGGYATGIPGSVRVIYLPTFVWGPVTVRGLEPGVTYRAFLFNPATGEELSLGNAHANAEGAWLVQRKELPTDPFILPLFQDWALVLETAGARL